MSEFHDLGAHCSLESCKQKDFLPFQCDLCKKTFCLDHREPESHSCSEIHQLTRQVPVCPLCHASVPFRSSQESPDAAISRHIDTVHTDTIPSSSSSSTKNKDKNLPRLCSVEDCDAKAVLKCKRCNIPLCVKHRSELDHECKEINKNLANKNKSKVTEYLNELHKQRAARQMRKDISEISENNKSKVKKRKLDTKSIHFANKKFNAVGQASVQHKDRVFLDVFFPLDSRVQPLHMFFNRRWVTGKVLDKIAVQGKIPNTNNRVSEEKQLALFNLRTQEKLPNSKTLEQLLQDGKIKQRDNIILERGLELDKQVLELLDNPEKAEQAQQNYCCIN